MKLSFIVALLMSLLLSNAVAMQEDIKLQKTLSQKEAALLFLSLMSTTAKYYYEQNSIDVVGMLDELDKLTKEKYGIKKQEIYKIFKKEMRGKSGFYTREDLVEKFSGYIDKKSDIEIKKIDEILYLRLTYLKEENLPMIKDALMQGVQKIIVDLRGNDDCKKEVMVAFANMLVDDKVILKYRYIDTQAQMQTKIYNADQNSTVVRGAQVVILTNNKTASSVEAVAHSLKYHENITVIGQDTAGMSNLFAMGLLDNADAYVLKNGEYFYGDFYVIDRVGLNPNIYVFEDNPRLDKTLIRAKKFLGDQR